VRLGRRVGDGRDLAQRFGGDHVDVPASKESDADDADAQCGHGLFSR
jgi:hypothetical protein